MLPVAKAASLLLHMDFSNQMNGIPQKIFPHWCLIMEMQSTVGTHLDLCSLRMATGSYLPTIQQSYKATCVCEGYLFNKRQQMSLYVEHAITINAFWILVNAISN